MEVSNFKIGRVFRNETSDFILSIDFDKKGDYCLTSDANDALIMYDAVNAKLFKSVFSKKYGCAYAKFTHKNTNVIFASTKGEDNAIRYLSFHDNKFLRFFAGHTERVIGLEISPQDDTFLSASLDGTVMLWDLKQEIPLGKLDFRSILSSSPREAVSQSCIAYDQGGLIFAVALTSSSIRLYDITSYDQGPFSTFVIDSIPEQYKFPWHAISFSNDGKMILVSTTGNALYIIDAYSGALRFILLGHENHAQMKLKGSFTPDNNFVLCGSTNGKIYFWSTLNGQRVCELNGHIKPSSAIAFNPAYCMFASADDALAFWIQG